MNASKKNYIVSAILIVVISIPSIYFLKSFSGYFGFLRSWARGPMRPSHVIHMPPPHRDKQHLDLEFVTFSLKSPDAKEVRISGDFSAWDPNMIGLEKKDSETWETTLALPKGRYRYFFQVDDKFITDPNNKNTDTFQNKKVSVIEVK
jgi:Glycogen recognition site of AMP-activated protein kinase